MTDKEKQFLLHLATMLDQKRVCHEDAAKLIHKLILPKSRSTRYSFKIEGKSVILPISK